MSSVEFPSTMITSWSPSGSRAKTCGRFFSSFSVGMTTLTRTPMGAALGTETAPPGAVWLVDATRPSVREAPTFQAG